MVARSVLDTFYSYVLVVNLVQEQCVGWLITRSDVRALLYDPFEDTSLLFFMDVSGASSLRYVAI